MNWWPKFWIFLPTISLATIQIFESNITVENITDASGLKYMNDEIKGTDYSDILWDNGLSACLRFKLNQAEIFVLILLEDPIQDLRIEVYVSKEKNALEITFGKTFKYFPWSEDEMVHAFLSINTWHHFCFAINTGDSVLYIFLVSAFYV